MRLCTICKKPLPKNAHYRRQYHAGACTDEQHRQHALKFSKLRRRGTLRSLALTEEYSTSWNEVTRPLAAEWS